MGVDDLEEDEEDDIDGEDGLLEYESTDSMTSAHQIAGFALTTKKESEAKGFLVKRSSTAGGTVFYQV